MSNSTKPEKAAPPAWLVDAAQGLAHWVAYRRSVFRHWPLPEAAFVSELCNLLTAHTSEYVVAPEVMYKKLVVSNWGQERADIVILEGTHSLASKNARKELSDGQLCHQVSCVIEVKRYSASKNEIAQDLLRLAQLKSEIGKEIRTFLVVVSEANTPNRFIRLSDKVPKRPITAKTGVQRRLGVNCPYYVRRVLKSLSGDKSISKGTFVVILENV